ncbi:AI-2E family transporter [Marinagarivorans cellulosilyticus]|uniref:Permease n=1 Tax=Marinagarivorans cellulosilyticus TaxID=2721545 RepID=A0AAN1WHS4_9GAMM|nr:AI-2E family transporter [Marinagarivorans cellulosilyticus]BCD97855.1 putative permease [Marinagarivorans cellulosilyticus]
MIKVFERWIERYFADEEAILIAVLLVVSVAVLVTMGVVLAPMIAAIIIAFLLQGVVARLEHWGVPHIAAVTMAFLLLVSAIVLILLVLLPSIWSQTLNLAGEAPKMLKQAQKLLLVLPESYPDLLSKEQMTQLITAASAELGQTAQQILTFSIAQLPILFGVLIYLVLVPILVFFFLKDGAAMVDWLGNKLPNRRPLMRQIWHEMNQQIANYVRGKVVEIIIVAGVSVITFTLLGVNYALLLAVIVGLSVLIPYIGAAVATIPVALIGFFQWGWGSEFMYLMLAYGVIQGLDGNVLVPLLFSEAVKMHPVAIVLAVLVFGGLWGFWGVFFAIPLATLVKAILTAWPTAKAGMEEAAAKG